MKSRIYVANLNYKCEPEELKSFFSAYGKVIDCAIVKDRETQRSRGFGFVEMATEGEAASAIKNLNGKDFQGRTLLVKEAQERKPREDRPRPISDEEIEG